MRLLQPLFDTNVLQVKRVGAGQKIVVRNRKSLENFSKVTFPAGLNAVCTHIGTKADAVKTCRDSKKAQHK